MAGWGLLLLSVVFNVIGVIVVKHELNRAGTFEFSLASTWAWLLQLLKSPVALLGGMVFFASPFLFGASLSRLQLATVYPVQIGLNFILVLLCSVFFLGEKIELTGLVGMVLILAGVLMLIR
jgi:multidrug transporter EmrE-like cation transporter